MLLGKPWNKVKEKDLEQLINMSFEENTILDFNRSLPSKKNQPVSEQKKFSNIEDEWIGLCKLVCAFLNTKGGTILIGIHEKQGIATKIEGIEIEDWERLRQTLTQKINNMISPSIEELRVFKINLSTNKSVLVIEIPFSLRGPHMVRLKRGAQGFMKRVEAHTMEMTLEDIREAFLKKYTWENKAKDFRAQRIEKILSGDAGPLSLAQPAFLFHFIPLGPRERSLNFNKLKVRKEFADIIEKAEPGLFYFPERLCYEGIFVRREGKDTFTNHILITRNGEIEFASTCDHLSDPTVIFLEEWEKASYKLFAHLLPALVEHEIHLPFLISCSVVGVLNYRLQKAGSFEKPSSQALPRNRYDLPEIEIIAMPEDRNPENLTFFLKEQYGPIVDMIWNDLNIEAFSEVNSERS